jgi:DUF177 domain-containing protein
MKIHLAQIPEQGLVRSLRLELGGLARLSEAIGPQSGVLEAELRIKNREGAVDVRGRMHGVLQPPCQRCLEPVRLEVDEPLDVALVSEASYANAPEDARLGAGDLEVSYYQDEELDLSHILEDELLLLIPEPVAETDDEDRCVICGRRSDELLPQEGEGAHPFAALKGLLEND